VQYALAVPGVLAISASLRTDAPRLARIGTPLALAGIAVIVVFQALLVAGTLSFEQEIGPAGLGFLVVGVWMVAAAFAGRRTGDAPAGPWTSLAAALYLGYPLWAYRVGRWTGTRAVSHETTIAPAADRA
jgi:hypothetical protein